MKTKALMFLFLASVYSFAQEDEKFNTKFTKAKEVYAAGDFFDALPIYLEIYRSDTTNANINYLVGECYLKARSGKAKALPYLERAKGSIVPDYKEGVATERRAPIVVYKLLGDAYHINSQFDKAILSYETYKKEMLLHKKKDKINIQDANRKIEMCVTGKKLMASPVRVKIENMGKGLNSLYADYSPVITADQSQMIFTSRRKESTGGKTYDGGRYFEDIYITQYKDSSWTKAENINSPINTDENEASVGISPDGQEILIYKDDNGDGNIYSTTLDGDIWTAPSKA
jgi:hypothetical protein